MIVLAPIASPIAVLTASVRRKIAGDGLPARAPRLAATFLILLSALAAVAAEPVTSSRIVVYSRGGKETTIPLPAPDAMSRVIVELMPNVSAARFRDDLAGLARSRVMSQSIPHFDREYRRVLNGVALSLPTESLAAVRSLRSVRAVHDDPIVHALTEPGVEPGVVAVRAPEVWSTLGVRGAGMTIAIIDTGIDYRHPALGGGLGPAFKVIGGHDFVDNDEDPMDENGHGTHVAGIVAANSAEIRGVAPDASLLAFRVLDANGQGRTSDVIAAIERAVDPNGDGNPSDHVQVANLSLGGPGGPDDPLSRAVNAAVNAGVVVCVAAGNSGQILGVISPGTAERAITVGASLDDTRIAQFSARGPNVLTYTIKPDLVAPGVGIRSTAIGGGGVVPMSGTSMATPHVSGVAALLRQLHPEWTPAMVKSALVSNALAFPLAVTEAGSGRVDALRAATATTFIEPISLSFGVTDGRAEQFAESRTLRLTNRSSLTKRYTIVTSDLPEGVHLTVTPSAVNVPAGESSDVDVTLTVENAYVPFTPAFSIGGVLEVRAAGNIQRLPWAFVKGLRVRLNFDGSIIGALITGQSSEQYEIRTVGDQVYETLVEPGIYDVTMFGTTAAGDAPIFFAAFEGQIVQGDREYLLDSSVVRHRIRFRGLDETGVPFKDARGDRRCFGHRTLLMPPSSGVDYLRVFYERSVPEIMTSTLSDRYVVSGGDVCRDANLLRVHVLHYPSVRGVSGDVERVAGGPGLHAQRVSLSFPPEAEGVREIVLTAAAYTPAVRDDFGFIEPWLQPVWNGTVFFEPVDDPDAQTYAALEAVVSSGTGKGWTQPEPLRFVGDRVASFKSRTQPPTTHLWAQNETMAFGTGFSMPRPFYGAASTAGLVVSVPYAGAVDESRVPLVPATLTLTGEDGHTIAESEAGMPVTDLSLPVRLVIRSDGGYWIAGVKGKSTVTARFGGVIEDSVPPTFTALTVLDDAGLPAMQLAPRSTASLIVAAIDYGPNVAPAPIKEGSLTVAYRLSGTVKWRNLPVVKKREDYGTSAELQHDPRGSIYRAALSEVTNGAPGLYDLRLSVEDLKGNASETFLEPAFLVGPGRVRAVQK
jgi:subtilisin family serine protease